MTEDDHETVTHGTRNIFADLGRADAEAHLLKAELVGRLHDIVQERGLTQTEVARTIGISQPDVSRLLRGRFRDFSVERLMRFLTAFGCEVDIVVRRAARTDVPGTIKVRPDAA
jgi:predicted XRE-type DNA-binding protein